MNRAECYMDVRIKLEQSPIPEVSTIKPIPLLTQPTQESEPYKSSNSTNSPHMKLTALDSPSKRSERAKDVSSNGKDSPTDLPVVDLRLVKLERFDDGDEKQGEVNEQQARSLGKESLLIQSSNQDLNLKNRIADAMLLNKKPLKDSSNSRKEETEENAKARRFSDDTIESFPYRVPIVYPIQSPPIEYHSIEKDDHSQTPKDYRLERDRSRSPIEHQRLYEDPNWSMESPRGSKGRFDDNSSSNFPISSRLSPTQKHSPYTGSPRSESKDDSTSSQTPTPSNSIATSCNQNAERSSTTKRSRYKNIEIMVPGDTGDREEESLWKQVQRYRYRKRLPLGKLAPTQEETIFMQYNEIRERRHREGRVSSKIVKPVQNFPVQEQSPSSTNTVNETGKSDTDPKLQGLDEADMVSPPRSPEQNGDDTIRESIPYVNRGRQPMHDVAKSNGITYVYVTAPPHESRRSSLNLSSSNPEQHPGMFDGSNECGTNPSREHTESHPIKVHHGYHGYMSPDPHRCHSHESRGMEVRGRTGVRSEVFECRGYVPYEERYHDNSPYPNHKTFYPPQRFHASESCYDNKKRRMHSCGHYCCRRKKMRTISDDDDDSYGVDNDDSSRWQRLETREREVEDARCHEAQNGRSRQDSPASLDSRDNESIEKGPTQRVNLENDIHAYENGRTSKDGSPGVREGEEDAINSHSSLSLDDTRREHDDDDVICQVNGLFSLPGYRETKYDITKGELKRRTGLPETLTRVEMISYVRQAKTSGRMLLDTNGITTSNRSHPTILSRVCESEAQLLASGIHKMNLEYLPLKKLAQTCMDMYKSRGCDGCQDCRMKLRRKLVDVEITRSMLKEFLHVVQEASAEGTLECYELASHTFGTLNIVNHLKLIDEYYKLLLLALDKE